MKIRNRLAAVSTAIAGFTLTAGAPVPVFAQGASPVSMVLISQANEGGFPLWLAKKLNYFSDRGIDAKIQYFPNGGAALASGAAGDWQGGWIGSPPAITGWAKFGLIPVGTMMKEDRNLKLIMRKDALKGSSPREVLQSKPIGSVPNSTWSQVLFACAKHFGVDAGRMKVVPLAPPVTRQSLRSGEVASGMTDSSPDYDLVNDKENFEVVCDGAVAGTSVIDPFVVTRRFGVDSYYGYTKMLWLRNHRPDVFRDTHYFLPPNAYVIHALTGEVAVDRSSAGNIGGIFDMNAGEWSREMLDALGIPLAKMPPRLVGSSEIVGRLTAEAGGRIGLPQGTPVVAGGVDAAVATFGAGVVRAGQHVAMIGSSMCWGYISQEVDARHGLVSMPYVYGGPRDAYVFGGAITAGAAVTWFRDHFCRDATAAAQESGVDVHDLLDHDARGLPEGADGVLFLPYLMGERSPVWDGKASGAFVGLSLYHRREHLYRAVLEGVTFALRHNIEAGARGAGFLDDQLIVVGGAARSDLWMQIIADITGRPVMTIEEEVEAPMGAALLAAYGVGLVTDEQVRKGWVTLLPRAQPRPHATATYDRMFRSYKALYPALKPTLHELHEQRSQGDALAGA